MAPALGKRPREVGVHTTGNACVHGVGWRGYLCKECPGKGICEHGRQRSQCKECRAARDAAAPVLCSPVRPEPEILVEFDDVEDPGDEDE